jgi:nitrite reductase/ring-hydroxylating ferredoxin subunit
LSEGDLSRDTVICPWHSWSFDLRTGQSDIDPDKIVATYEVVVENETIYIRLPAPPTAESS